MKKTHSNTTINPKNLAVIIPTYNAPKSLFKSLLQSINYQTIKAKYKLIIDSESSNDTVNIARLARFDIINIKKSEFNHGKTRDEAVRYLLQKDPEIKIIIFLTQDCLPAGAQSFENLLTAFDDNRVAVAYGRQLTGKFSSLLETVSRRFNYPDNSYIKTFNDAKKLGMNTPFLSNSYSAYRVEDYLLVGGFKATDFGEDMLIGADFLKNRRAISYRSNAMVYHSHSYSIKSEYERGKLIAIMHNNNPELLKTFGKAESRGMKMIMSAKFYQIPVIILQSIPKLFGYKINRFANTLK